MSGGRSNTVPHRLPVIRGSVPAALLLLLLLAAACTPPGAGVAPTFAPPPTAAPLAGETATAALGTIVETVETRGRVVAQEEALLVFPLDGALKAIHASPGDQVEQGALIAELDAPQTEEQALVAQFDLALAEAGLENAEGALEAAEAAPTLAQVALDRASTPALPDPSADETIAANALARAELEYEDAWVEWDKAIHRWWEPPEAIEPYSRTLQIRVWNLEAAQARLAESRRSASEQRALLRLAVTKARIELAQAEIELSQAELAVSTAELRMERARALDELAAEQLTSTRLLAPFPGIIISVDKRAGDLVGAYEAIGAIADPSELWLVATVPEEDVIYVTPGQAASGRLDAYPDRVFAGRVVQVASEAIIWQGRSAYEVTIAFDEGQQVPATIRMGADISIAGRAREDALLVPARAVITVGGQSYVDLVGEDGAIERVAVETGVSDGSQTEIVSGLRAGQGVRIP